MTGLWVTLSDPAAPPLFPCSLPAKPLTLLKSELCEVRPGQYRLRGVVFLSSDLCTFKTLVYTKLYGIFLCY